MKKRLYRFILLSGVCMGFFSCNGYLEEMPQNKLKPNTTDDYDQILNKAYISQNVVPYLDILTDDIAFYEEARVSWAANYSDVYFGAFMWNNNIETTMSGGDKAFELFYNSIFNTNVVIDNIDQATGAELDIEVVQRTRNHIKGEAYALRAFDYFYLVNLYAQPFDPSTSASTPGIPINLESTAEDKAYPRASLQKVYEQITGDLIEGIRLMEENAITETTKTKFNALSAKALLARVYLYMQEWDLAINNAKEVIAENPALFDLREIGEDPVVYTDNILTSWRESTIPGIGYLSAENDNVLFVNGVNELYNTLTENFYLSSFGVSDTLWKSYEPGDVRKYYFIRNYRGSTDIGRTLKLLSVKNRYFQEVYDENTYETIQLPDYGYTRTIRTEEMYLILAEAYAHKADGIATAINYMNMLREKKFRQADYTALKASDYTQESLLKKIMKERRTEFCFEEHRWFDLRRTTRPAMEHIGLDGKKANLVENDPRYTLQIPQKELSINPEIGTNPR